MTVNLDYNQRLHLIAALDLLESPGRREAFAVCRLQEKLDLTDEERQAIGFRKTTVDGREFAQWSNNGFGPREYDLTEDEIKRLCNAVDRYPVVLGRDKHWWQPLMAQLPVPAESNGREVVKVIDAAVERPN